MAKRASPGSRLPPPYLKRVWLDEARVADAHTYPFNLPMFRSGFEWRFERPITILVGENGVGKSTLLEGIAALAGYDDAGGGKGYRPVDHSDAIETSGGKLADALRAAWLPKVTDGWFFRAETFFSVARYLDAAGSANADFLSHSHGEGFMRFFEERLERKGIYFFDEPEAALSPMRQVAFLKVLHRIARENVAQVIIATHAPILMACPDAQLVRMTRSSLEETTLVETEHFRLLRDFYVAPDDFVKAALGEIDGE